MLRAALDKLPPFVVGPIARGGAVAMSLRGINVAMGFATTILLARVMGAEAFGVFGYGAGVALLVALPSRLGFQHFLVRVLPGLESRKDWQGFAGASLFAFSSSLAIAAACSLAAFILIAVTTEPGQMQRASYIGAAISPFIAITALGQSFLRARMKMLQAFAPEFVIVQAILLCTAGVGILTDRVTPEVILIFYGCAWATAAAASVWWMASTWPRKALLAESRIDWRSWASLIPALALAGSFALMIGRVEPIALAAFASPTDVGVFTIALRFALLATLPGFAVSSGLGPTIARLQAEGEMHAVQRRLVLGVRAATAGAALAAIGVIAAMWLVLPLLDRAFEDAKMITILLLSGFVFQAATGRALETLNVLGHVSAAAKASLVCAVIYVILIFALTDAMGIPGAALAAVAAICCHSILLSWLVWKATGLRSDIFAGLSKAGAAR